MTPFDFTPFFQEILNSVLASAAAMASALGVAALSGGTKVVREWLDAHHARVASEVLGRASEIVQTAADNEAGEIAMHIKAGAVQIGDVGMLTQMVTTAAGKLAAKVPESLAKLKPAPGSVEQVIMGKLAGKLPGQNAPTQITVNTGGGTGGAHAGQMPTGDFEARATWVVKNLMLECAFEDFQAIGVVGNLAGESGLKAVQEVHPTGGGLGGYGWAQWTGPRRRDFVNYCTVKGLSIDSDQANFGFLVYELQGKERGAMLAIRDTKTLAEACAVCEAKYERAGIVRMSARQGFAQQIATAWGAKQ
jgi:hypothetical protein